MCSAWTWPVERACVPQQATASREPMQTMRSSGWGAGFLRRGRASSSSGVGKKQRTGSSCAI